MPTTRPVQPVQPQEHAERIRAALAALNAAVLAAARDGVGITYREDVGLLDGALPPAVLTARVWHSL